MTIEYSTTFAVSDVTRLTLTCHNCGHGVTIPLTGEYPHSLDFGMGEDADCDRCHQHWWGRRAARGQIPDPPSGTHLPPLIRALIAASRQEENGVSLGIVVASPREFR